MENLIKEKDKIIEDMGIEKKSLEKIKRDQERDIKDLASEKDIQQQVLFIAYKYSETLGRSLWGRD